MLKLLLQLFAINGYGIHGDELYYIACSNQLDFGYVDHPSFSIILLYCERILLGDSIWSLRLLPSIAGFLTVIVSGLTARRMGAGLFGQLLTEICVVIAPIYLALNHFYSMNSFDLFFWVLAMYLLVRIIDEEKPSLWLWLGFVIGLGFENKIGILSLGFGIAVSLLLSEHRRAFLKREVWIGACIALLLMVPYIFWQHLHNWATLEWMANARAFKMEALSPGSFMKEQIFLMQPLTVFIWGGGVFALFFTAHLRRFRVIGLSYLIILLLFIIQGAKPYYLTPFYPVLFASGAIILERWINQLWLKSVVIASLVLFGTLLAPLGLPLLKPEKFMQYEQVLGMRPKLGEKWAEGRMPAFYANFFGWEELEKTVAAVFRSLPAEDQKECGIYCQNYMQAGAIDYFGITDGLPKAISGHNNYWLWGPGNYSGTVMIIVGGSVEDLKNYYDDVTEKSRFQHPYVQPMQTNLPIYIVKKPKYSLQYIWPKVKSYI